MSRVAGLIDRLRDNIESVFLGKPDVVKQVMVALMAGGHLLLEDVPGVGKTTLARALAQSIDGAFRRIQFTPDLLPSDILGVSIYLAQRGGFEFQPGPVFANILLADEINRTTPRTQSALLEAMNEGQVTIDGKAHALPAPFMVLATQNPYEFEGTYPLPESQLDRFLMRIRIGYPAPESEEALLYQQRTRDPILDLGPIMSGADVQTLQQHVREAEIETSVARYLLEIVRATRQTEHTEVGASPRASLALSRASQALATLDGRNYVIPDDVKALAVPVLAHRIICRTSFHDHAAESAETIVEDILESVEVPV